MKNILVKRPIVIAVIGYIIGILWGLYFNFSIVLFYFPIIVIYFLIKNNFNQRKKFKLFSIKRYFRYVKLVFSFDTIMLIIIVSIISNIIIMFQKSKYDNFYKEGPITLTGIIVSYKIEKEYKDMYKIKVEVAQNNKKFNGTYLYLKVNKKIELKYGDKVKIKGEYEKPEIQRNYKGYDAEKNQRMKKIHGTVRS